MAPLGQTRHPGAEDDPRALARELRNYLELLRAANLRMLAPEQARSHEPEPVEWPEEPSAAKERPRAGLYVPPTEEAFAPPQPSRTDPANDERQFAVETEDGDIVVPPDAAGEEVEASPETDEARHEAEQEERLLAEDSEQESQADEGQLDLFGL